MSDDELTDKQRAILKTKKENPDMSNEEIAVETDASASYVSQVTNEYDESDLKDGSGGLLWLIIAGLIIGAIVLGGGGDGGSSSSVLLLVASVPRVESQCRSLFAV